MFGPFSPPSSDYFIDLALGKVPGQSGLSQQALRNNLTQTYTDVWGGPTDFLTYPAFGVAESLEIVSDNVNDTAGGTGARLAVVTTLDANLVEQVNVVPLTAVSPAATAVPGTHRRTKGIIIVQAGSSGVNEGTISLQAAGGGNVRNVVKPGFGASYDSHFTVPAGKQAVFITTFSLMPKDGPGSIRTQFRDGNDPDGAWVSSGPIPLYQNIVTFVIRTATPLGAGFDVRVQALVDTGDSGVFAVVEAVLADV